VVVKEWKPLWRLMSFISVGSPMMAAAGRGRAAARSLSSRPTPRQPTSSSKDKAR